MLLDLLKKEQGNGYNNIRKDSFDDLVYEDLVKESLNLRNTIELGKRDLNKFDELAQDVFNTLYKVDPTLVEQVPQGTELNRKQIETLMSSKDYKTLRDYTPLDDVSTGLACLTIVSEIRDQLLNNEKMKELAKKQNQNDPENQPQPDSKGKQPSDGGQKDNSSKGGDEQSPPQPTPQQELQQALNQNNSTIRRAIRDGAAKASKEAEENDQAMQCLCIGTEGTSELKKLPLNDRLSLLNKLKGMAGFVDLLGKAKAIMRPSRQAKLKSTQVELCGLTVGNDVSKALPQELMELRHPQLKYNFYRKFLEKQLMQYELKKNEDAGKGPVVVLVDDSGSMYDGAYNGKTCNAYKARALMAGLLDVCAKEKRSIAVDIFAEQGSSITQTFYDGKIPSEGLVNLLTTVLCGGTDFSSPIEFALEKIQENKFTNGDIIIITDGAGNFNRALIEKIEKVKAKTKANFLAISLDDYGEVLKEFCDKVYYSLEDETMSDIVQQIK